ncbi:MAG: MerR family DNA-binding transcriptional regulator [Alphaproteobacteria bacterium]
MNENRAIDTAATPSGPARAIDLKVEGACVDLVAGVPGRRSPKDLLTTREMTREFNVTARALRFYEERGLIAPRREGQDRLYSRRDCGRLRLLLMGKTVGFSLEEVKDMLDLYDLGDGGVTQLKVSRGKFREQIERLMRQRNDIDIAMRELDRACGVIDRMLAEKQV